MAEELARVVATPRHTHLKALEVDATWILTSQRIVEHTIDIEQQVGAIPDDGERIPLVVGELGVRHHRSTGRHDLKLVGGICLIEAQKQCLRLVGLLKSAETLRTAVGKTCGIDLHLIGKGGERDSLVEDKVRRCVVVGVDSCEVDDTRDAQIDGTRSFDDICHATTDTLDGHGNHVSGTFLEGFGTDNLHRGSRRDGVALGNGDLRILQFDSSLRNGEVSSLVDSIVFGHLRGVDSHREVDVGSHLLGRLHCDGIACGRVLDHKLHHGALLCARHIECRVVVVEATVATASRKQERCCSEGSYRCH